MNGYLSPADRAGRTRRMCVILTRACHFLTMPA
jgi:hypothetical protein